MNEKSGSKPSTDEKLKILYDHYKDSFANAKEFLDRRDRIFYVLLVVLGLTVIQITLPTETINIASEILSNYVGVQVAVGTELANSVLWFALLSLLVRYYQSVVYIQRIYPYIHKLEENLSSLLGQKDIISREGKYYLKNYPLFSKWSWQLYTIFLPALVVALTGWKVISDYNLSNVISIGLIINCIIFLAIVVSTSLYLLMLHFEK